MHVSSKFSFECYIFVFYIDQSGEASSSNKKESKKQKAERETTANGKENKKSKVGDDKINGEQCAKKQEEIWDKQKGLRVFFIVEQ